MTPGKRLLDLLLAIAFLPVLLPVGTVVALMLLVGQGRPVFHRSERMKTPAQAFRLWKFRTMAVDPADEGVTGGDKAGRVTRAGAILRRSRLDELPQLFNILRGDMSFVGPRPPLRRYVERFPATYRDVLRCRPGVTGLASLVYHRHEEAILSRCVTREETEAAYCRRCIPTKARLDRIYCARRSACLDLLILWRTLAGRRW